MADEEFTLYHYEPSLAAAVIFAACFGLSTAWHGWQLVRWKAWYFIPFMVGGICKQLSPKRNHTPS